MKFVIEKGVLLRELALIQQSVIDKRNAIPALSHIRIEASGKRVVRLAGTDLDQTLQCETEGQVQKAGVCALPGKKLFEIIKQLPDAEVRFESKENERVVVTCERAQVKFDCAALLQIVRRVSVMTDERSRAMRLEFTKNKLTVRSEEDEQGAAEETVEIEYKGAPTVIGINSTYLSEYLSVLGSGAIRFEFKDGKTQVLIRPLGEAGYNSFNIIMPMNLGDATPSAPSASATEEKTQTQEEDAPVAQAA